MLDVEFGYFGLAQGIGRTFGSIFYTVMVNQISAKWLGGAFSIVKGFVLASFELTQSKWILIFLRGVIGFVHMPPSTYIPIWIDQYGLRKYKTVQMSFFASFGPCWKSIRICFS
jgi:predicted MFS family arabinose efflux permease